jgi:predicted 3-demethylubiquinone-9 3-methyltransferase (glyoxalase superfamily)
MVRLDPRGKKVTWVDDAFRVAWSISADELRAVAGN